MLVTHYSPWLVRNNLQAKQALDRFFNESDAAPAAWTPRVDVREETSRFVIVADVPGVDPATLEIQMDKNVLTLKGERKAETHAEGTKLARVERTSGHFERHFTLPESADADAISAAGKHGVLEISIPKKAQLAPRRIAINA